VRQAEREWYFTNRNVILNQDPRWKQSAVEAQLYYAIDSETNLFCVILVHTDDYVLPHLFRRRVLEEVRDRHAETF
jgi:hypothetical protein